MVSSVTHKGLMYPHTDKSDIFFTEENEESDEILPGYLRVSEILSPWKDFSSIDPQVLAKAADRGTRTHHHCEIYAKLLKLHACHLFHIRSVEEDCLPYFTSYKEWFDEHVEEVMLQEERFYCDIHRFCGKVDQIVRLKGDPEGYLTLIDIKTPQTKSASWDLQTAAYQYLIESNKPDMHIRRRVALMLKKNGKIAKCVEYTDSNDIKLFISACQLYKHFNPKNKKV